MFHKVKFVAPLPDCRLSVQFIDGIRKIYDVKQLFDEIPIFKTLENKQKLFYSVKASVGGYGIIWNEDIDLSCDELWENGELVESPFDNLIALSDATKLWGLNESTLRKAISYGKLINGVDVMKFGKQWIVTMDAMKREYGEPKEE